MPPAHTCFAALSYVRSTLATFRGAGSSSWSMSCRRARQEHAGSTQLGSQVGYRACAPCLLYQTRVPGPFRGTRVSTYTVPVSGH